MLEGAISPDDSRGKEGDDHKLRVMQEMSPSVVIQGLLALFMSNDINRIHAF